MGVQDGLTELSNELSNDDCEEHEWRQSDEAVEGLVDDVHEYDSYSVTIVARTGRFAWYF